MGSPLFATKPIETLMNEAGESGEHCLKRALGPINLVTLGIGAIIGAGIFVITGQAAAQFAGPAIIISFVLAGVACAFAGLCYAEFASLIPIAGSAYTCSYATLGELVAWIIGWDLILEYAFGAAAVSIGWLGYVTDLIKSAFGITLPKALTISPFSGGIINLPAFLIILLLTLLLIVGTSETSRFNNVIVGIKLAVILFFIVVGFGHVNPANWSPFLPFGPGGIFRGAAIIFFAYIGFDQVSTSAEEARNPAKDLPLGILLSLGVCTLLYIVVTAILTGIVSYTPLNVASPVSHALLLIGLKGSASIISVGAICG